MPRHTPAASRHGRQPSRGPSAPVSVVEPGCQPLARPVAVDDQGAERRQHPEHQQGVEQRGAAVHVLQAVEREQQPGDAAEQRRAEQPAADARDHQDGERAGDGGREPPAERGHAEQPLAGGDDPLADRRVHDVGPLAGEQVVQVAGEDLHVRRCPVVLVVALDVVLLDAEVQQRPGVLGVVGLVEDERLGRAEPPEPQEGGERGDEQRPHPAPAPSSGIGRTSRSRTARFARVSAPGRAYGRRRPRSRRFDRLSSPDLQSWTVRDDDDEAGVLVLAGTPIGDPADASPRLREALASADVVAAEDTRRLRRLARDLGVSSTGRVVSYYDANEAAPDARAGRRAAGGGRRRWSSPTPGMPAVSDPGYRLVAAAIEAGVRGHRGARARRRCSPRWRCPGCRPTGSASRASCRARPASGRARLAALAAEPRTLVFFEAPHRLAATLAAMADGVRRGRGRRPSAAS